MKSLSELKKERKIRFSKWFDPDPQLNLLINDFEGHKFLMNPPISNIYQYLAGYVYSISCGLSGLDGKQISILDWGTGKGHVTYFLRKAGFENVVSCDIDSDRFDSSFGQENPIITACNIDVVPLKHQWKLPFENESFDVVVSFGVLEHVPNDLESLKELNRVLKKDGLLFCFHLPRSYGYIHFISRLLGDNYHDRLYSRKKVRKLLNESGFNLLDVWERSLFPKNRFTFKWNNLVEKADHFLSYYTPFKAITTNLEFLARKK